MEDKIIKHVTIKQCVRMQNDYIRKFMKLVRDAKEEKAKEVRSMQKAVSAIQHDAISM